VHIEDVIAEDNKVVVRNHPEFDRRGIRKEARVPRHRHLAPRLRTRSDGRHQSIVKSIELELFEPGLFTASEVVPARLTSEAGIATVRCEESTRVVVCSVPFQVSAAPGTNPEPFRSTSP
jgi:hypothetical protein